MEENARKPRKPNPRESANPISALMYLYMFPIFRSSYKHGYKQEDLFEALHEHKSDYLGDKLEDVWRIEHRKHKKSALHRALIKVFGFPFMVLGIFKFINEMMLVTVMPLSIGGLVSYFEKGPSMISENEAYMYAGVIIACLIIDGFLNHSCMMGLMHIAMKLRIACCSLLYRKTLRLSRSALAKTTIGQQINLLSNDVSKFDQGFVLSHFAWIAPIQTAAGTYLLYREMGIAAVIGIAFLLSFIPLQIYLAKRTSVLRLRTALRTDERVRLMNEVLSGIQVIKMYTWEKPFAKLVALARRFEIKAIRQHAYLYGAMYSLEMFITRTSIFISILAYIYFGNEITAETVFSVTAIYNVIRPVITMLFSYSISSLAEIHISISRLQSYLSFEELPQLMIKNVETKSEKSELNGILAKQVSRKDPRIIMKNVNAKWVEDSCDNTLTNLNIDIKAGQLVAVIGPVGSGKSSLFNIILKELPVLSGTFESEGRISYSSQEPWLFSGSIRQNILFGDEYDEERYRRVVRVCALEADFVLFPYGDRTLVGEKGKALSGGQKARVNLARCIYKKADIYLLDDPLSAVDSEVGKQLYEECITKFLTDKICILITHQLQHLKNADHIIILKDGKIIGEGKYRELKNSGLNFAKLLEEFHSIDEQEDDSKLSVRSRQSSESIEDEDEVPEVEKEAVGTGNIKASVYKQYLRAGGNYFFIVCLIASFIINQTVANAGDFYVAHWVNVEQDFHEKVESNLTLYGNDTFERDHIIYTYAGLIGGTIVMAVFHSLFFFLFFMRASIRLHDFIFEKISQATMRFFNANPSGRILNRFAKDIGIIDEYIPNVLIDVAEIALYLTGTIVLTSIVNPWLLFPSFGLMVLFYILRTAYLGTSRSIKRIEAITRSPIFSHMTASMHGLPTIRAFSAQKILIREFDNHQDLHSSAWYLFIASSRCFGFWLDAICIIFISSVTISLLLVNRGYYGGEVGLIITQFLGLIGVLQWGMRQWSELENQMTSVERVLEYTKLESEPVRPAIIAKPKDWPEYGKIEFRNVSLQYNPNEPVVLKDINFTIQPREKIGVVGRTGAGKSSTISSLFQLYEIEGSIVIDDIDTTIIPLEDLRSKISIIPQEPVLFSGTMRKNLDPFDEYSDDALWNALEQVELKSVIAELPAGLNSKVAEGGANFSVGQRQLVCLARAVIRNNKILVMDEATANVDPHTDALIQRTIRKSFANCTVLTIAHRLHTVMDSDKVLVMDKGKVIQFDHAYNLLKNKEGVFYNMVQMTGAATAKNLERIAEDSFMELKKQ